MIQHISVNLILIRTVWILFLSRIFAYNVSVFDITFLENLMRNMIETKGMWG